jgi:nicotinate phosphoribosyltransferase
MLERPSDLTVVDRSSTSLLTDHYELTMVDAALRSGAADRRAVFECFARRLPEGRRYGVVAGTARLVEAVARFRFEDADLAFLESAGFLSPRTLEWLSGYRFSGTITGYREGELFFPDSPVLTVESTFAEAVVLETVLLSILNHDSAVAAGGARMVSAAAGRPLIEAGSRRTHELAAPAAARAAYLVGFASTSNLEAGRRWGIPTGGTTAHAFILAHPDERQAFAAQVALTGPATTLLVDTFDVAEGIRNAVTVAGPSLGAIRIDSGDLAEEARRARRLLDELGATGTAIVVSGDLDESTIATLASAPVDKMLVGTQLVTGSGAPTAGLIYKLVAVADDPGPGAVLRPVAKRSAGKATRGGVKHAGRRVRRGRAEAELLVDRDHRITLSDPAVRSLQVPWVLAGDTVDPPSLDEARHHHARAKAELSSDQLDPRPGPPALPTTYLG